MTSVSVPPAPESLAEIAKRVDERMLRLLDAEHARWTDVDPNLGDPYGALRDLVLAGGKRLRPAFCHWAFVGAGGDPDDPAVVDAGAALELLHTFALIHDDIMDGTPTRRSRETAHTAFAERHALEGWRGESRRFGEGAAILIGDVAFVYADQLMRGAPDAALDVYDEMRLEVNVGQYLDLAATARLDLSTETARRICRYKSGKYTIERPLHLGAALAGRLDAAASPFSAYGLPLGEAFQLRDDLLGVFGDPDRTGKPVGEDLRDGKPTALLAFAAERATGDDARMLDRIGSGDLTADEVNGLVGVVERTGARHEVEGLIARLTAEALEALGDAPITSDARAALEDLARFVAGRDR